jgi:hypothetical protein
MNRLREALQRVDVGELEEIGQEAVQIALADDRTDLPRQLEHSSQIEAERQSMLDAALGDVVEIVNRHRRRLGRRICSSSDAKIIRQVHELLRGMADASGGCDSDPSFT